MENKENAGTTLLFEDSLPDWYDGKRMPQPLRVLLSSSAQTAEHNHVCAYAVGYYK